ncbi:MAG: Immunity protein 53, partial [Bacteroidota bacterium]
IKIPSQRLDNGDEDWYTVKIDKGVFTAYGDPSKLAFLIEQFKLLVVDKLQ